MTSLTLLALVIITVALRYPRYWAICLASAGMTPAGVAMIIGGTAVPTFYTVALVAAGMVALSMLNLAHLPRVQFSGIPGFPALVAFGVWSTMVTLLAPAVFPTLPVLGSGPLISKSLLPGVLTTSNIAQIAYLWVGIAVVAIIASSVSSHPQVVGVTIIGIVALSTWSYLSGSFGVPFPADFFDNNPQWVFIQTAPGGIERFRGILSEPASLGTYCIAAIAFCGALLPRVSKFKAVGLVTIIGVSTWLGIESTSTTFVLAGSVLAVVAAALAVRRMMFSGNALGPRHALAVLSFLLVVYLFGETLWNYVGSTLLQKQDTASFSERSGADSYSYHLILRTLGLGVGLGANRPSSFAALLLSNVGILGTGLFVIVVLSILRHSLRCADAAPTLWLFAALMIVKVISAPDLADPSGLLFVCLGVLAGLRPVDATVRAPRHKLVSSPARELESIHA